MVIKYVSSYLFFHTPMSLSVDITTHTTQFTLLEYSKEMYCSVVHKNLNQHTFQKHVLLLMAFLTAQNYRTITNHADSCW